MCLQSCKQSNVISAHNELSSDSPPHLVLYRCLPLVVWRDAGLSVAVCASEKRVRSFCQRSGFTLVLTLVVSVPQTE